jgi:hypothetical protein
MGLKFTFGFAALMFAIVLPAIYFLVPETVYVRPTSDMVTITKPSKNEDKNPFKDPGTIEVIEIERSESRKPYSARLRIFQGRITDESFWRTAVRPLPLLAYPAVVFSTIVYGSFMTWLIGFSLIQAGVFIAAPYHLNPSQLGLMNFPSFGAAIIGTLLAGWSADALVKFMARRNNGVYEPEFRLLLMIPAVLFSTIGFLGWGISVQNGSHLSIVMAFNAIHSFSVPWASAASFTYVIDCHPENANEAFVAINFVKAIFTFVASLYVNGWLAAVGPKKMFITITIINLVVSSFTIPMYIYGKRFRSIVSQCLSSSAFLIHMESKC